MAQLADKSEEQGEPSKTSVASQAGHVAADGNAAPPKLPKIVEFHELSRCGDEVWISHNGQLYRLRTTRQGKLILTK